MPEESAPTPESHVPGQGLRRLETVVAALRAPGGCPWDREQNLESLRPCLIEEAYELLDAIDSGSLESHREELGDLLLQIVFQAQLRKEKGEFTLDDVAHAISDKLVRRHPHVFGNVKVKNAEEVLRNWEGIKKSEGKGGKARPTLSGVPRNLPSLLRAQRVQAKCAKVGFEWVSSDDIRAKINEELGETDSAVAAGNKSDIEMEIGDLLFAIAAFARFHGVDAECALRGATDKFSSRFEKIERTAVEEGVDLKTLSGEELLARWKEAKKTEE